jgi:hypothetical protein
MINRKTRVSTMDDTKESDAHDYLGRIAGVASYFSKNGPGRDDIM